MLDCPDHQTTVIPRAYLFVEVVYISAIGSSKSKQWSFNCSYIGLYFAGQSYIYIWGHVPQYESYKSATPPWGASLFRELTYDLSYQFLNRVHVIICVQVYKAL